MRVLLRTFGCRANQYDSEQVRALIEGSGGTIVEDPAEPDTAVFNSCAVTSEARRTTMPSWSGRICPCGTGISSAQVPLAERSSRSQAVPSESRPTVACVRETLVYPASSGALALKPTTIWVLL